MISGGENRKVQLTLGFGLQQDDTHVRQGCRSGITFAPEGEEVEEEDEPKREREKGNGSENSKLTLIFVSADF